MHCLKIHANPVFIKTGKMDCLSLLGKSNAGADNAMIMVKMLELLERDAL